MGHLASVSWSKDMPVEAKASTRCQSCCMRSGRFPVRLPETTLWQGLAHADSLAEFCLWYRRAVREEATI